MEMETVVGLNAQTLSVPILSAQKKKVGHLSPVAAPTWNPERVFSTYQPAVAVGAYWSHTVGD
jgi:hypothetical protein